MKIRKAKIDEWSSLQDLNEEIFSANSNYDSDIIIDWAHSKAGKKYFKELVSDPKSLCLIVESNSGKLIGYLAACPKPVEYRKSKYFEIENMGVIPEYRSKGLGKELMDNAVRWGKENGFQKALVNSYSRNKGAIKFYEKCGYSKIDISLERGI